MTTLTLLKPRGFSLRAASDFYAGFTPGSGMAAAAVDRLTLAFRTDETFEPVLVALREDGDHLALEHTPVESQTRLAAQVARILGLDVDGEAWLSLGARDRVVGKLQAEFPGFFTAAKASPYDAAAWGVISPRMNMRAAAALKMAIAEKHGDRLTIGDRVHHVFPSPTQLLGVRSVPGLAEEKLTRLHGIARAALQGKLEATYLRLMPEEEALAELQTLRGVGPWTASHILYRGAAAPDALPTAEPRVLHGLGSAYQIESPTVDTFVRIAEGWRPFRMWVCILLARHLGAAGGWKGEGLVRERAALGRRLAATAKRAGSRVSSPVC